jgi:hypothetical protein
MVAQHRSIGQSLMSNRPPGRRIRLNSRGKSFWASSSDAGFALVRELPRSRGVVPELEIAGRLHGKRIVASNQRAIVAVRRERSPAPPHCQMEA